MILLDDHQCRENLFPFTHIRHVSEIRVGIFSIREKWERLAGGPVGFFTGSRPEGYVVVPADIIPSKKNYNKILSACIHGNHPHESEMQRLLHPWQIFEFNDRAIREDFELLTSDSGNDGLKGTQLINPDGIIIEPGADVSHCIINANDGPVYIASGAKVMEGSMIRGPFAMLGDSVVKMGAKIYGATTVGPSCIVGGEIKNSVFFGHSNKAHDGYLGDSVIGEWCNIGAGSSNSNIRNNASAAAYQLAAEALPLKAGVKAGLLMGDFSRCAINTSFYTASVVGICCNIFGETIPQKYTGHFTWGNTRYELDKAIEHAENWMRFKGKTLSAEMKERLIKLYQTTR